MEDYTILIDNLNHEDVNIRLDSLKALMEKISSGELEAPIVGEDVNNHIHTIYSFSPYSPAKALWMAYNAGLKTAGIMDHDSISGAREFIAAGKIIGMATTIGIECRVDMSATILNGKKINNPDQNSIAYMALHGIPHTQIDTVQNFFAPFIELRNIRNKEMISKINEIFKPFGIEIGFEKDVKPLSMYHGGGSITERHLSMALTKKLIETYGKGKKLVAFLKTKLQLNISLKIEENLMNLKNPYYDYDLLGLIKSDLISSFYVPASYECPDVMEVLSLSKKIGSISAYAYLGDVGDSVTGDKKTQKFEDDYLTDLFKVIHTLGFNAVTYMPSRNTLPQLTRLKALCEQYSFFQISGEDINSPRQAFVCAAMKNDAFKNLITSTWALIGHEKAATKDISKAMFSNETIAKYPDLNDRINAYKKLGISLISED
jgi:hypothetical protein